ncbi:alkylation response protein AidB-like acyl-CoA dehydrogenase [Streptacidiphilus sp. MAP12-16]|uniref:acyl-CoA dehydrogenase family protein n=1 Tax=Streptacidiphilus sp. MAP12-16 TaxID=3156300 RepID=UPI0035139C8B
MDFRLTEDQRSLRGGLRELLVGRFGPEQLRGAVETGANPGWAALEGAGLFSLRTAESDGGLGLGVAEAVLAFEEVGRSLVPGPLVGTELAAVHAGGTGGVAVLARTSARGPLLVERLPSLQAVLVLDPDAAEVRLADPAEVPARRVRSVDPLTPLWEVTGPLPRGVPLPGVDPALLRAEGMLLTAALQVGLATRAVESAVGYAKQREQFGQPIGAFQAVQHLCADILARTEPARAAVRAAAVGLDAYGPTPDVLAEVAGAKLLADEAAVRGARDCLQVFGGMGFTWEADVHLLLKRAWVHERAFAGAEECAERLAAALVAPVDAEGAAEAAAAL